MIIRTGVATREDYLPKLPSEERRARDKYAMIECFTPIPCNPCTKICPHDAIAPMADINDVPVIDFERCNGCGLCASVCPGLAIFIIDETYSDTLASVMMPYEFYPLPEKGQTVKGLGREGEVLCDAKVLRVVPSMTKQSKTPLVTVEIPKEFVFDVRFIQFGEKAPAEQLSDPAQVEHSDDTIVCRCEGITLGEIRALIADGYQTFDEIKRISRAGMGPCQGRTCRLLIMQEIGKATGAALDAQKLATYRPPLKPMRVSELLQGDQDE